MVLQCWPNRKHYGPAIVLMCGLLFSLGCADDKPNLLRAKKIETRAELIGGPVAMADIGDFLLENDQIRIAILGARHSPAPGVFGGSLVDADLRRPNLPFNNAQGRDRFAETFPIANLLVPDPETAEISVVNDGADGKEAIVRVSGKGAFLFEAIGVLDVYADLLKFLFADVKSKVNFRTDYVLRPGERYVTIRTTILLPEPEGAETCPNLKDCTVDCPFGRALGEDGCFQCECGTAIPLVHYTEPVSVFRTILGDALTDPAPEVKGGVAAGDFMFFGNQNDIFAPGMGYDEDKTVFDALFAGRDTFQQPLEFDFVAASGGDVSYGYFTAKNDDETAPPVVNIPIFTSASTAFLSGYRNCLHDTKDDADCDRKRAFVYERYFVVGQGDIDSVAKVVHSVRKTPVGQIKGYVRWSETGQPVPNAHVFVFANPDTKRSWKTVDEVVEENLKTRGDVGMMNVVDADVGLGQIEDGDFRGTLPEGDYVVVATDESITNVSAPISVTVKKGQIKTLAPGLLPPAKVQYRISDETGKLSPAKIAFISLDQNGKPLERDALRRVFMGTGRLGNGIREIEMTASGEGELDMEPGRYRIVVSRGPEYSLAIVDDVILNAGQKFTLNKVIVREVDTSGWVASDMHLHARPSFDSGMPLERRVVSAVVEGLEFAVSTDHDVLTDLEPYVRSQQLEHHIKTAVGAEVSTLELGHYIGFPLHYDELDIPDHGVHDWTCNSAGEVLNGIRSTGLAGETPLTIVAHPRDGFIGYIDQLGVDPFTMDRTTPFLENSNPLFRTASCDFDAMELFNSKRFDLMRTPTVAEVVDYNRCYAKIQNAESEEALDGVCPTVTEGQLADCKEDDTLEMCKHRQRTALAWEFTQRILIRTPEEQAAAEAFELTAVDGEELCDVATYGEDPVPAEVADKPCTHHSGHIDDYFQYLQRGFLKTQIASSDGHGAEREPGMPRTYFRSATDSPQQLDAREIVDTLRSGQAFPTYGPFIRASVHGKTFGEVAHVPKGQKAPLQLNIQTASWFGVDRIEIYVGGSLAKVIDPESAPQDVVDYDGLVELDLPDHDSWVVVVVLGLGDGYRMTPIALDVPFGELQLPRVASLAFSQIPLVSTIFTASPPIPDWFPIPAFAVTNAIYFDTDNNGKYDPPLDPPDFCSRPCDPQASDPAQCPGTQVCLPEEGVCGYAIEGECEDRRFLPILLPDGDG